MVLLGRLSSAIAFDCGLSGDVTCVSLFSELIIVVSG
jgi:hypothetical protein